MAQLDFDEISIDWHLPICKILLLKNADITSIFAKS